MRNGKQCLVVMIPAFNEEKTISKVIKEIPRTIEGISSVKVLVVNDGSTDNTVKAALKAGAGKVVSHKQNFGLAAAFRTGLQESLMLGADVIVNTDADFQYDQKEIPKLIRPILDGKADLVLTFRNVWGLSHMPLLKKIGNSISTFVASFAAGISVKDAQSGFRAFSKEAALRLNVLSNYTYVQETIIQAASKNLAIMQLPCRFRKREGKSRLILSIPKYARNVFLIILRNYVYYRPLKFFLEIGGIFFLAGLLFGLKVLLNFFSTGNVSPFLPTAVLSGVLVLIGFQLAIFGLIADSIKAQRQVMDELLYLRKKTLLEKMV